MASQSSTSRYQPSTPLRRSLRLALQSTPKDDESPIPLNQPSTVVRRNIIAPIYTGTQGNNIPQIPNPSIGNLANPHIQRRMTNSNILNNLSNIQSPTNPRLPPHPELSTLNTSANVSPRSERSKLAHSINPSVTSGRSSKRTLLFDSGSNISQRHYINNESMFSLHSDDAPIAIRKTPRNSTPYPPISNGMNIDVLETAITRPRSQINHPTVAVPIHSRNHDSINNSHIRSRKRTDPGFVRLSRYIWSWLYPAFRTIRSSRASKSNTRTAVYYASITLTILLIIRLLAMFFILDHNIHQSSEQTSSDPKDVHIIPEMIPIHSNDVPDNTIHNIVDPELEKVIESQKKLSSILNDIKGSISGSHSTQSLEASWKESIDLRISAIEKELSSQKNILDKVEKETLNLENSFTNKQELSSYIERITNKALLSGYSKKKFDIPPDHASLAAGTIPILELSSKPLSRLSDPISRFFGIGIVGNPPSIALTNENSIGKCFSFKGDNGKLAIKFRNSLIPKAVSVDHIMASEVPDRGSAPRKCQVWGLKDEYSENTATLLGSFEYDLSGDNSQYFPLNCMNSTTNTFWDALQLRILSNWGNEEYTCLYRWRVHI